MVPNGVHKPKTENAWQVWQVIPIVISIRSLLLPLRYFSLPKFWKKLPYLPLCFIRRINKPKTPWQVVAITCHEPAISTIFAASQQPSAPDKRCLTWFVYAQSRAVASRPPPAWKIVDGGRFLHTNIYIRGRVWRTAPQSPCLGHIGLR